MTDPAPKEEMLGRRFGRNRCFVVERHLSDGGMGRVYVAFDTVRNQQVAMKFLWREHILDPEWSARFIREGRKFARIRHENVVRVYGVGQEQGCLFIVAEYIPGQNLSQILEQDGPFELEEALRIGQAVALGCHAAHSQRIVHRDLKPANIMVRDPDQVVKVLDFGIAKSLDSSTHLTRRGSYVGTPGYSSPEQARGAEVDHRADIFALGVILYEMLSGQAAFQGQRTSQILESTLHDDPPSLSSFGVRVVSPAARLIKAMIQKNPRRRPADMMAVATAIEDLQQSLAVGITPGDRREFAGQLRSLFAGG